MAKKKVNTEEAEKATGGPRYGIDINGLYLVIEFNNGVQTYEGVNGDRTEDFDQVTKKHSFASLQAAEKAAKG